MVPLSKQPFSQALVTSAPVMHVVTDARSVLQVAVPSAHGWHLSIVPMSLHPYVHAVGVPQCPVMSQVCKVGMAMVPAHWLVPA